MELDIQWLAERLLKARIEANQRAYQSWLATAYWCTQLAKARLRAPPNEISYTLGGKHKRVRLHLFEKTKATEICNSNKPSELATQYMEKRVRDQGEPYDKQVAEGQHPGDEQDLLKVINEVRESQDKEANKKKAKALAKWKKRVQQSDSSIGEEEHPHPAPEQSGSQGRPAPEESGSQEGHLN